MTQLQNQILSIILALEMYNAFNLHPTSKVDNAFCGPRRSETKSHLTATSSLGGWELLHGPGASPKNTSRPFAKDSVRLGTCLKPHRLDRILSERGLVSRRQAEQLAQSGKISFENGTKIRKPSVKLPSDSVILVNGRLSRPLPPLLVYHKPRGIEVTMAYELSPEEKLSRELERRCKEGVLRSKGINHSEFVKRLPARQVVNESLGVKRHVALRNIIPQSIWKAGYHPVGRLDVETTGLLLLSCDGNITNKLLHPINRVEREYVASVINRLNEWRIRDLRNMRDQTTGEALFTIRKWGDYWIRLIVREGRHRVVRKALERVDCPVETLKRVRFGSVVLGEHKVGSLRLLDRNETQWLTNVLHVTLPHTNRHQNQADQFPLPRLCNATDHCLVNGNAASTVVNAARRTQLADEGAPPAPLTSAGSNVTDSEMPEVVEEEVERLLAKMRLTQGFSDAVLDVVAKLEPRWTNVNWRAARERYEKENHEWEKKFADVLES